MTNYILPDLPGLYAKENRWRAGISRANLHELLELHELLKPMKRRILFLVTQELGE
jgi:hypothetical protein